MASDRTKRFIALAIVYIIWGSTYLAIRYAILTIPPLLMAGTRFAIAGAILYAWTRFRGEAKPKPVHWRNTAIIGILLLLCGNGGVVWAEQTVPSGIVALLVATVPLWLVVLNWLRPGGTRPGKGVILGIVVGLAGVIELIGLDTFRGHGTINATATGVVVIAALAWAGGSLFARTADLPSPFVTTAMEMLVGGAALVIAGIVSGELHQFDRHAVSATSLTGLIYLIIFGSLIAYTAYTWLVRNVSAAIVGTYAYVNPVVAVFLGWLIASEPVTKNTVTGAAIIIAAVIIITQANATPQNPPTPAESRQ